MTEHSRLTKVEKLLRAVEAAHKEAARLNSEPTESLVWPAPAVAEAEELAEVLAEAAVRARKLYALTPPEHELRELEQHRRR